MLGDVQAVSKTVVRLSRTVGSNPTLSAIITQDSPKGTLRRSPTDPWRNPTFSAIIYTDILTSHKDDTNDCGSASDLNNRLKVHNAGKVRSTKGRRPWKIIYREEFSTRSDSMKREAYFKSIEGYNWLRENKII